MKVYIFLAEISLKFLVSVAGDTKEGERNVDRRNFAKFRLKSEKSSKTCRSLQFIGKISVCIADFSGNFPYFLLVQPTHRIQNLSNFFLKKKRKMLFGNLIMICRQRLCFSAWLKNRGFRVREI